jgi:hypothetical protein
MCQILRLAQGNSGPVHADVGYGAPARSDDLF